MSAALDKYTDEDTKLIQQMRDDDRAAPEPAPSEPEPAPAATVPEPAAVDDDAPVQPTDPRMVPLPALHQERQKRRELEEKLAKAESERIAAARLEERYNLLIQAAQNSVQPPPAAAPTPAPIPEFNEDPAANISANFKALREEIDKLSGFQRQQAEAQYQRAQVADLQRFSYTQETEFEKREPDYRLAVNDLITRRNAQLEALGIADPTARQQIIANDTIQIAARTRQDGRNFAEVVFALAKANGWQKPAAAAPAAAAGVPALPGVDAVLAAPATAAERTAQLQRGRDMATTISGPGTAPPGKMTPERIANLSESEFAALYAKVGKDPAALRELFGD